MAKPHKHSTRQRTTDFMVEALPRPARRRNNQMEDYPHARRRLTTSAHHHTPRSGVIIDASIP